MEGRAQYLSPIFCPSVCRSGYKRQKCKNMETRLSQLLIKIEEEFSVHNPLIYEQSICSIDILYDDGLSVRLQKAEM